MKSYVFFKAVMETIDTFILTAFLHRMTLFPVVSDFISSIDRNGLILSMIVFFNWTMSNLFSVLFVKLDSNSLNRWMVPNRLLNQLERNEKGCDHANQLYAVFFGLKVVTHLTAGLAIYFVSMIAQSSNSLKELLDWQKLSDHQLHQNIVKDIGVVTSIFAGIILVENALNALISHYATNTIRQNDSASARCLCVGLFSRAPAGRLPVPAEDVDHRLDVSVSV